MDVNVQLSNEENGLFLQLWFEWGTLVGFDSY